MLTTVGLFYATQTDKTESIAEMIQDVFGNGVVNLHDISQSDISDFNEYDDLTLGCPTWNLDELQREIASLLD
jgi:flavodoxin I